MVWSIVSLLLVCLAASLLYLFSSSLIRPNHLPPSPPGSYLYGTPLPSKHPWKTLKTWTDQYGPLITIHRPLWLSSPFSPGSGLLFVCGDATTAHELLTQQAFATSSRPDYYYMAREVLSGGKRMLLMSYGPRWRKYRRTMHEFLRESVAVEYGPMLFGQALKILCGTAERLDTQDESGSWTTMDWEPPFKRYAAGLVMKLVYDYTVQSPDEGGEDPLVTQVNQCLTTGSRYLIPQGSLLDQYTILRYLPLWINPWLKTGQELHRKELSLFLGVFQQVRERRDKEEEDSPVHRCFAAKVQQRQQEYSLTDEEACYLSGSLFGAGSDTTSTALSSLMLGLVSHPDVLAKLQQEVDSVLLSASHPHLLPDFSTRTTLFPYTIATLQESARWRAVSAGGMSHALTQDLQYKDWILPKGASILANHWAIHMDEKEYGEKPEEFRPERFLVERNEDDTSKSKSFEVKGTWFAPTRGNVSFGYGRRVCSGVHVAERSLFIMTVLMVWTFDFRASPDGDWKGVDTTAFNSGANSRPDPFKVEVRLRSKDRLRLLKEALEEMDLQ